MNDKIPSMSENEMQSVMKSVMLHGMFFSRVWKILSEKKCK